MAQARFTPDLDLDGLSPDEAFAILGNDIRLAVIRVLWRADAAHEYDDGPDTAETMPYSELQAAVGIDDNGKLNYHLSQLAPPLRSTNRRRIPAERGRQRDRSNGDRSVWDGPGRLLVGA